MTTANQVLDIARSQIGTAEFPNNSNNQKYGIWYGMNYQPWCAIFVSWCTFTAGIPLPISSPKGFAYCPSGLAWFRVRGRLNSQPSVGAVVFYGTGGLASHTGIVESFTDNTITVIEGNTSIGNETDGGSVMRRTRARNNWILGYGVPEYAPKAPADQPVVSIPTPAPIVNPAADIYSVEVMVAQLPVVKQGDNGQFVKILQGLIVANGGTVTVDGDFGPGTAGQLKAWQGAVGITPDAVCGPVTWRRLLCI